MSEEAKQSGDMKYEKYTRIFDWVPLHDVFVGSIFSDYVDELFKGRNHICLFYGQTGSGKTYSMLGENNFELEKSVATKDKLDKPQDTRGLLLRTVKQLFK